MKCHCLQDITTVRGASSLTTVVQPESGWLDLSQHQDLVAWLDVHEVTSTGAGATVVLNYQTSPTKDDDAVTGLFVTMASVTISMGVAVTVTAMLKDVISNPLARWLRWQLVAASQSAIWDATFRIWIAASMPGRRGAGVAPAPDTRARRLESTPSVPLDARLATTVLAGPDRRGPFVP